MPGSRGSLLVAALACFSAIGVALLWTRPERRAAYAVAFAPGGDRVAAVGEGEDGLTGQLGVWEVATGRPIASATVPDRPLSLAFTPDGSAVATGGWNGTVSTWDPATGHLLRPFPGHTTPVRGLAFTPESRPGRPQSQTDPS